MAIACVPVMLTDIQDENNGDNRTIVSGYMFIRRRICGCLHMRDGVFSCYTFSPYLCVILFTFCE